MSIASQLTALEGNISDAYDMVAQRGGTVPARKNMENLDDAIATIPSGGAFIGIPRKVTTYGIYKQYMETPSVFFFPSDATSVAKYAFAYAFYNAPNDNSPTGVDGSNLVTTGESSCEGAFEGCAKLITADFSSLTTAGAASFRTAFKSCLRMTTADFGSLETAESEAFRSVFNGCSALTSVDFSALKTVQTSTFSGAFSGCTSLTTVDMSSVTSAPQSAFESAFRGCTSLTSADFSGVQSISGSYALRYMFYGCTSLTSADFSGLQSIDGSILSSCTQMFYGCTSLTTMSFTSLSSITTGSIFSNCFQGCTSLNSVSFPALTTTSFGTRVNQFDNMLNGCTGVTVHFPAAIQSTIGSWTSVTNGFGGTNTTVLFDL